MLRRVTVILSVAFLIVAVSAADTQAARYRFSSYRSYRSSQATYVPRATDRVTAAPYSYRRVPQNSGRRLWNLGMQNGEWPR